MENKLFNRPDWSTAPDWAQWWALDANGDSYWYERRPAKSNSCWLLGFGRAIQDESVSLKDAFDSWETSLQKRLDNE